MMRAGVFIGKEVRMTCDRCGAEPDADLTRYVAYEADEEALGFLLCPGCSYGFNTLMRAYVANRELTIPR
jgi:hypothetical protein